MDWAGLMRAGLRGLRLSPQDFWRLTPAELAFLLGHGTQSGPLTRDRLAELARAYPDHTKGDGNG